MQFLSSDMLLLNNHVIVLWEIRGFFLWCIWAYLLCKYNYAQQVVELLMIHQLGLLCVDLCTRSNPQQTRNYTSLKHNVAKTPSKCLLCLVFSSLLYMIHSKRSTFPNDAFWPNPISVSLFLKHENANDNAKQILFWKRKMILNCKTNGKKKN